MHLIDNTKNVSKIDLLSLELNVKIFTYDTYNLTFSSKYRSLWKPVRRNLATMHGLGPRNASLICFLEVPPLTSSTHIHSFGT